MRDGGTRRMEHGSFGMSELFRLRTLSRRFRYGLFCSSLPLITISLFAADIPSLTLGHRDRPRAAGKPASTARVALFERNDAPRAAQLAKREIKRSPRNVDGSFLAMEAAVLLDDAKTELASATTVCKLAKPGDPRATVAAMRLTTFGQNSEALREERSSVEAVAGGESACAPAAVEALFVAALDGLPQSNVRDLAQRAGWLTKWTVSRTGNSTSIAERFEFADARIQLPDYLPRTASYVAETIALAPRTGSYLLGSNLAVDKVLIDDVPTAPGAVNLSVGPHRVRISFRPAEVAPRIRIARSSEVQPTRADMHLSAREKLYLEAAVALAAGRASEASGEIRESELAATEIGQALMTQAARMVTVSTQAQNVVSHASCGNLEAAMSNRTQAAGIAERLQACAPDSLAYARWLAVGQRHAEAIQELSRVVREWPLDRDAHRLLIAELQRVGNNTAADRAAAAFLAIAPNARNFRRMAKNAIADSGEAGSAPFYESYRRAAPAALSVDAAADSSAVILLQDKVSVARPDGSVSLYMHRVLEVMTAAGAQEFRPLALPDGAQLLTSRVVNAPDPAQAGGLPSSLKAGDEIEEEYVVNYTGDGGMIAHPEAFQYVFNDFDFPMLDARFVVLSPGDQSPGYVIASGNVPASRMEYVNGICAQIWEKKAQTVSAAGSDPAIVRVVENENGWSIPPSVERRRILETIHPGPRLREA